MPETQDDEPTATLYYSHAVPQTLMADLETLARGLPVGAIVRIQAEASEVRQRIPNWCAAHGWRILHSSDNWELELEGSPSWKGGKYRFDIVKETNAPETPA